MPKQKSLFPLTNDKEKKKNIEKKPKKTTKSSKKTSKSKNSSKTSKKTTKSLKTTLNHQINIINSSDSISRLESDSKRISENNLNSNSIKANIQKNNLSDSKKTNYNKKNRSSETGKTQKIEKFKFLEPPFWRLKYRPNSLQEIKNLFPKIYAQFSGYVKQNNFPHLLLVGPPGSGKTMLAEILAKEILKSEYQTNCKLLFATDRISQEERKEAQRAGRISTSKLGSSAGAQRRYRPFIQVRVKPFVSSKKFGDSPFKILIIKEFDALDVEQQAFRRLMEQYSSNCRMILITSRISNILDPIISRCQLVMVPYIADNQYNKYIASILKKEGHLIKLDALNFVKYRTRNNIGEALDLLQLTSLNFKKEAITTDQLAKLQQDLQSDRIKSLFISTTSPKTTMSKIRDQLRQIFWKENLSKQEILVKLSQVISTLPLERAIRAEYFDLIAETDFQSLDSNDDEIQLDYLLVKMLRLGAKI